MNDFLQETTDRLVRRAIGAGATTADVFARTAESFAVTVRNGDVDRLKESSSRNLHLRVFVGRRSAMAQTSDLSRAVLDNLVQETLAMAQLTSEDGTGGLPSPEFFPEKIPDLGLSDPAWADFGPDKRIELARRAEAAALSADTSITNSDGGTFEWERTETVLANSLGFVGGYEATTGYLAAVPVAGLKGSMQRDYWLSVAHRPSQLEEPEVVGRTAAKRALRRLGARKIKTCEAPVVFDSLTARTLVKHLFDAVSGDATYRRRSFLVDKLDTLVANPQVTIMDDARIFGGLASCPFDDEGVSTGLTPIVENGVLKNYLHNAYTARRSNARPTGNGNRTGTGAMTVAPTNFHMQEGTYTTEEILSSVESGLYVVELIGFGVNTVNGDYSRGVTGLWIEGGRIAYPVHEVTIAGNLRDMFSGIEMIGNDTVYVGAIAAPTLKIGKMTISGD